MIENEDTPIFDEVEAYDSDQLGEEQSSLGCPSYFHLQKLKFSKDNLTQCVPEEA